MIRLSISACSSLLLWSCFVEATPDLPLNENKNWKEEVQQETKLNVGVEKFEQLLRQNDLGIVKSHRGPRREFLVESRFGVLLADPYRWMENADDPELVEWVESQSAQSSAYVKGELYDEVSEEIRSLLAPSNQLSRSSIDFRKEMKNKFQTTYEKLRPEMLLGFEHPMNDPIVTPSPSGNYSVEIRSDSGSDLRRLQIVNQTTNERLADVLTVKFASVTWEADEKSFIYTSYRDGRLADFRSGVFRHVLGTSQADDQVLYVEKELAVGISLLEHNGRWLMIKSKEQGGSIVELDLETGITTEIVPYTERAMNPFHIEGDLLYSISYRDAALGEIISIDLRSGQIQSVMPEQSFAIESAYATGDYFYVSMIEDAASSLIRFNRTTKDFEPLPMPKTGRAIVFGISATYLYVSSYSDAPVYYVWNESNKDWFKIYEVPSPSVELESFRTFYRAHNGKQVPIWITKKKGLKLTKNTPIRLYGYGGFSVNILPNLNRMGMPWYKRGGVDAYVTLPGGMEYGREWHEAGMGHNKDNVFDDFAAAAKHLIDEGFTRRDKLIAHGASNGGLLVAGTINRYPHLFAAAVPEVGVLDMTRFQLFTTGKWWMDEYGDRNNRLDFYHLLSVSPYHNIRRKQYPSVMVMTSDFDDRVVPAHSFKYAAELQHKKRGNNPVFLFSEKWASHGGHGNLENMIHYFALRWTFMMKEAGIQ